MSPLREPDGHLEQAPKCVILPGTPFHTCPQLPRPEPAKLCTVAIVFPEKAPGAAYVAAQECDPMAVALALAVILAELLGAK